MLDHRLILVLDKEGAHNPGPTWPPTQLPSVTTWGETI